MGLATRIISVLLYNEFGCIKGKRFNPQRCIGSLIDRVRLLERRDIDELILLDISATPNNRGPRFKEIRLLCDNLFMPVTIGGGIDSIGDIRELLAGGADKVAINTAALMMPNLIDGAARRFGSQAIVISIDVKNNVVYAGCGRLRMGRDPVEWARQVEDRGAGEILLNSIERDGMMNGYDLDLIDSVSDAVDIPVIACGGCGSYEHMHEVLSLTKAHAVAVGAAFQFREMTPKGASRYLHEKGLQVRL